MFGPKCTRSSIFPGVWLWNNTATQKVWATVYRIIKKSACKSLQKAAQVIPLPQGKMNSIYVFSAWWLSNLLGFLSLEVLYSFPRQFLPVLYHLSIFTSTKTDLTLSCASLCPLTSSPNYQGHGYQTDPFLFAAAWYILQNYDFLSHSSFM